MNPIQLIELLKIELQKFGEELADLFPERIKRLSDPKLSEVWGINVSKLKLRLKGGSRITNKSIEKLELNIVNLLGERKGKSCLRLIEIFKNNEILPLDFIELIRYEIGRFSGLI